jgi:hypothetical protein
MKAKEIVFHIISLWVLFLSTIIGLAGVEEFEGGYLWELMCVVSPLFLGIEIHVIYLKIKSVFTK